MKSESRVCVVCGQPGTAKWTISSANDVAVVSLCVPHSKPLSDIVAKSQEAAGGDKKPWGKTETIPQRIKRGPVFEPLDWTPPEEKTQRKEK